MFFPIRTFSIQTLGCKVNQYETEQWATLLRSRGLVEALPDQADLRIINTCSVTIQAASKSRQLVRRAAQNSITTSPRVIITGCWATSDKNQASQLPGVDAVIGHNNDIATEIDRLLAQWSSPAQQTMETSSIQSFPLPGTAFLPLLSQRQTGHQRAFLKIQDGCDAHCTYCIIPKLRSTLWSKPLPDAIEEARRLVAAGHVELILTGIFLGAYGQPTALRRRQSPITPHPLTQLIDALCTQVPGLRRLRLSSLEPADLTPDLISVLKSHPQVVPHFHLPLQSGSDDLLRRMNRQYRRDDFLRMVDQVRNAFDRPALTTDIIVAFPGETDELFQQTLDIVDRVQFIHIHAFPYSPRPGTAAARWKDQFVHGPVINQRINTLSARAQQHSLTFRTQFLHQTVLLLVEHLSPHEQLTPDLQHLRHGRCERYFSVFFDAPQSLIGQCVQVRIDRITPQRTLGTLLPPTS